MSQESWKLFKHFIGDKKNRMENVDHLQQTLCKNQDCLRKLRLYFSKRLHEIPCSLSSSVGNSTCMDSLFPSLILHKIANQSKYRICRRFDAETNKNYFGAMVIGWKNSAKIPRNYYSTQQCPHYLVFVFNQTEIESLFWSHSMNETFERDQMNNHQIASYLGHLLLDETDEINVLYSSRNESRRDWEERFRQGIVMLIICIGSVVPYLLGGVPWNMSLSKGVIFNYFMGIIITSAAMNYDRHSINRLTNTRTMKMNSWVLALSIGFSAWTALTFLFSVLSLFVRRNIA